MREIKFRAWNKEKKKYYHDVYLLGVGVWTSFLDEKETFKNIGATLNDVNILEQYTGLKDKNGVEIYEGDIVVNEDDLRYAKSLSHEEIIEQTKKDYPDFLIVKYGLQEVDAFYGMAFNMWSFQGGDNGERLSREHIVVGNIHEKGE